MIESISLINVGPIEKFNFKPNSINLIIGSNGVGKTFLLKMLYTIIRASEEYRRGDDRRKFEDVLSDKLYWTFQVDEFNKLINKKAKEKLFVDIKTDYGKCTFSFGDRTTNTIIECKQSFKKRDCNSVFFPAKEVLSILHIIKSSRDQMRTFGFDDTYLDLANALSTATQKGRNYIEFADARTSLEKIIGGSVYNDKKGTWSYRQGKYEYPIGIVSEGIKKISIIDTLLGNRYLSPDSIIFVDEPESALHPSALNKYLEILYSLSTRGIQIFMASHSYFTIKKLFLLSKENNMSINVVSLNENKDPSISDLKNGMPDNSIIRESIDLYEKEVELSFK